MPGRARPEPSALLVARHAEDEDPLRRQEALPLTATGKVRGRHSFSSHILEKKSPKRKRQLARPAVISKHDEARVKILLGAKRS